MKFDTKSSIQKASKKLASEKLASDKLLLKILIKRDLHSKNESNTNKYLLTGILYNIQVIRSSRTSIGKNEHFTSR